MKVAIVGAGVAGLTCAVELAERGVAVEVFERGKEIGPQSCSWYAGAMLAPWCEAEQAPELVSSLGERSVGWWKDKMAGTVQQGTLVVAHGRDAAELDSLSRRTQGHEWLDASAIAQIEPALADRFTKALYFKDEGHLDPRAALQSLAERFESRGGTIYLGVERGEAPDADLVIDCTGLAARRALKELRGVKGEMVLLRSKEIVLSRPIRLLHPRIPVYIVPRGDGVFMVGATMIESDDADRVTARSLVELLSAAYVLHPAFADAEVLEIGTQVRPAFPDNLPRIVKQPGKLYINGFFRHGFLLAPAFAQIAADVALGKSDYPGVVYEDHR